jgi:hypothetical protein
MISRVINVSGIEKAPNNRIAARAELFEASMMM